MTTQTYPIVGAYHRPPALALLKVLSINAPLILRPEPENPYDNFAVMVIAKSEVFSSEACQEALVDSLSRYGFTVDQILEAGEWHLGYIPRGKAGTDITRAEGDLKAYVTYGANGSAMVTTEGELVGVAGPEEGDDKADLDDDGDDDDEDDEVGELD